MSIKTIWDHQTLLRFSATAGVSDFCMRHLLKPVNLLLMTLNSASTSLAMIHMSVHDVSTHRTDGNSS
jgi:hypothetical protein